MPQNGEWILSTPWQTASMLLKTGLKWKSRYEILDQLGEGGFATVYLALDHELNRKVAIKVLKSTANDQEGTEERFQREAKVLAKLRHPNILTVYSFETLDDFSSCLLMEYLEGESLESRLLREGSISEKLAKKITAEITEGLIYAHSFDVIHRDLSTANIFLVGDRNDPGVKIIDFGLSSLMAPMDSESLSRLTATGLLVGNPSFMSPEQSRGGQLDERSDIYSLGCVLYRMVSGDFPFNSSSAIGLLYMHQAESPPAPKLDWDDAKSAKEFSNLILKCLQKDPDQRFQSARDIKNAIADPGTFLQTQYLNTNWAQKIKEGPKFSGKALATVACLCALIVVLASVIVSLLDKQLLTVMQKSPAAIPYENFLLDRTAKPAIRISIYKDFIAREAEFSPKIPAYLLEIADCYMKASDQQKAIDSILGALEAIKNSNSLSSQERQRLLQRANNAIQLCDSGELNQAAIVAMSRCLNEMLNTGAPAAKSKMIMMPLIRRVNAFSGPLDPETKHEAAEAIIAAIKKNIAPTEDDEYNATFLFAQVIDIKDCVSLLEAVQKLPEIEANHAGTASSQEFQQLCFRDTERALSQFDTFLAKTKSIRGKREILEYFISTATQEGELARAREALKQLKSMNFETSALLGQLEVDLLCAENKHSEAIKICHQLEVQLPRFESVDTLRQPALIYDEYFLTLKACMSANDETTGVSVLNKFKECITTKGGSLEGRFTKYNLGRFAKLFYRVQSADMMQAVLSLGKCSDENSNGMCQRAVLSSKMYLAMQKRDYKEAWICLDKAQNLPSATDAKSDNAHFASMIYAGLNKADDAAKHLDNEWNQSGWNVLYAAQQQRDVLPKSAELMIVAIDMKEDELACESIKRALNRAVAPTKAFAVIANALAKRTKSEEFKRLADRAVKESGYSEHSKYPVKPCTPFKFVDEK